VGASFKVITFYTSRYTGLVDKWTGAAKQFGYDYACEELPDTGKWNLNVLMKAEFVLGQLNKTEGSILWIDMDGTIVKPLTLIDELCVNGDYDMAIRRFDITGDGVLLRPSHKHLTNRNFWQGKSTSSATMWYANNERSRVVLEREIELVKWNPDSWYGDEDALNCALYDVGDKVGLRLYDLPLEYCFMSTHVGHMHHDENEEKLKDACILQDVFNRKVRNKWAVLER